MSVVIHEFEALPEPPAPAGDAPRQEENRDGAGATPLEVERIVSRARARRLRVLAR